MDDTLSAEEKLRLTMRDPQSQKASSSDHAHSQKITSMPRKSGSQSRLSRIKFHVGIVAKYSTAALLGAASLLATQNYFTPTIDSTGIPLGPFRAHPNVQIPSMWDTTCETANFMKDGALDGCDYLKTCAGWGARGHSTSGTSRVRKRAAKVIGDKVEDILLATGVSVRRTRWIPHSSVR